jgi:hypothetical protein
MGGPKRPERRECYNCGKRGLIAVACPEKKKKKKKKKSFDFGEKEKKQNKGDAKDMFALNVCKEDENKKTHA